MVPSGMSIEAGFLGSPHCSGALPAHIRMPSLPTEIPASCSRRFVSARRPLKPLQHSIGRSPFHKYVVLHSEVFARLAFARDLLCDDPIEFVTMPRKGEPTRLAFIAPKFRVGAVIVPDPIEAKDQGCTRLRVSTEHRYLLQSLF